MLDAERHRMVIELHAVANPFIFLAVRPLCIDDWPVAETEAMASATVAVGQKRYLTPFSFLELLYYLSGALLVKMSLLNSRNSNVPVASMMDMSRFLLSMQRQLLLLAVFFTIVGPQYSLARPPYKHSLKKLYGARLNANLHQCSTCHMTKDEVPHNEEFDEDNPPHNDFGKRLKELGESTVDVATDGNPLEGDILSRLKRIVEEDSDGDGVANEVEILAGKQPGRAKSYPDKDELLAAKASMEARQREATGYAWEPFRQVQRPRVPKTNMDGWVRTPIDAFVAAEYDRLNLQPTSEAPKHTLLRRVYLDLVGIPPSREELNQFLADDSPFAYEHVVERLLASPGYGQRWGRHWMDIWRYSDWAGWTGGRQIRDSQPHIWKWRDWIIDSLNADRPYSDMVCAMLAADEITPDNAEDLKATGFLVRNYKMLSRETWMQDTVEHTCKAFLAITMNCARCHDHMYDPITQSEYYQFRAIFEPHNVRADRVAHQSDIQIEGLARAYDAEPGAATYIFIKGDDRNPEKEHPVTPGVPLILGQKLTVNPIELPLHSYYPGSVPFVREQMKETASQSLDSARQELAKAEKVVSEASEAVLVENPSDDRRQEYEITKQRAAVAQLAVSVAELELRSLRARIAADDNKFTMEAAPCDVSEASAKQAAMLERDAMLAAAQLASQKSDLAVAEAEAKLHAKPHDAGLKKKLTEGKLKQDQAAKALEEAKKKSMEATASYTPLTPVYPRQSSGRRAGLARWLTARENPLTARVAVNHIWNRHFGRGLVPSVFDFGQNGKPPTHPALLDWLAAELMEPSEVSDAAGQLPWSMKHIHRLIVTSSVYRLSSNLETDQLAMDPDNEYISRAPTKRMEAEVVRDSVLHVSSNLDREMGGPDIDFNMGFQVPRRSLYFRHAAEKEMTFLKIFDAAAVTECYQRKSSVMPQQALAMINSELTIAQSRHLVRYGMGRELDDPAFVEATFEQILCRRATNDELMTCVQFLKDRAALPTSSEIAAHLSDLTKPSGDPSTRARELLVHVLINHHEFVSIY